MNDALSSLFGPSSDGVWYKRLRRSARYYGLG